MITARVAQWNQQHPDEHVTLIELPRGSDNQRQQMIQNANTKSDGLHRAQHGLRLDRPNSPPTAGSRNCRRDLSRSAT